MFIFRALLGLVALVSCVDCKRVVPLKATVDPETGKVKRQITEPHQLFQERDFVASNFYKREPKNIPIDLDKLFETGQEKRDMYQAPFAEVSSAVPEEELSKVSTAETLCLDSRIATINEIGIFSSYIRGDAELTRKLEDPQESLIIFAPSNAALEKLSKKPWEFPTDIEALESSGADQLTVDRAISDNIMSFIKAHIVLGSDFEAASQRHCKGSSVVLKSMAYNGEDEAGDIKLKRKQGKFYVLSANQKAKQEVLDVTQAQNGAILLIDSALVSP
ncbi:LAMI_0B03994g1_1 [Lachancea mirantina]|uniref:LAMI_0B03994g1_1 n=1 Tax=Lachancea mirantina TaxID=1230905 RepID=A0A1G4IV22_9SACH|nr:LAMI_0B03994g1_1 [Lachancea mirantina]